MQIPTIPNPGAVATISSQEAGPRGCVLQDRKLLAGIVDTRVMLRQEDISSIADRHAIKLYDRTTDAISLDEIERILI